MEDWSATRYLKFEDDRTRPPRDLVAQVPLQRPRLIVDLGCGPGNSTKLWSSDSRNRKSSAWIPRPTCSKGAPAAAAMQLRRGRHRHLAARPAYRSHLRQCGDAMAAGPSGDHAAAARRHAARRRAGDPDARQYARAGADVSARGRRGRPVARSSRDQGRGARRPAVAGSFYDLLKPVASHIDIWHSVYNHVMASPEAITEWFKGSSLQPFLSPLNAADREKFLAAYTKRSWRLQAALRRQGAAALPAPVHPGGAMTFKSAAPGRPSLLRGEGRVRGLGPLSRNPLTPTLSPLGRGGSHAACRWFLLPRSLCCSHI